MPVAYSMRATNQSRFYKAMQNFRSASKESLDVERRAAFRLRCLLLVNSCDLWTIEAKIINVGLVAVVLGSLLILAPCRVLRSSQLGVARQVESAAPRCRFRAGKVKDTLT